MSVYRRERYKDWTPDQWLAHRRRVAKHRYGEDVTLDLIRNLYEQQEGCCAICGTAGTLSATSERTHRRKGVLCIDHDHITGEVRGLLCTACNLAIGYLKDDPARLVRAANYINENRKV